MLLFRLIFRIFPRLGGASSICDVVSIVIVGIVIVVAGLHYETGGVSLVKTNYRFVLIISVARLPDDVHKVAVEQEEEEQGVGKDW